MTPMNVHTHSMAEVPPCGCGCSDCEGDCCALECPTRPNFFCGQILTDDDLKALVDWTTAKTALQRFKNGWGVACGLEVSCSHKNKKGSRVAVAPGYAVDCCGRDIVVCEPLYYDFKCDKPFDPCCPKPRDDEEDSHDDVSSPNEPGLGCIPREELRAFELCIAVDEKLKAGQRPLVRGSCQQTSNCEPTRILETGTLYAKEVTDPCAERHEDRTEKYRKALRQLIAELDKQHTAKMLRDWAYGKLHSFCFVEECLCELAEQNGVTSPPAITSPPNVTSPPSSLDEWKGYIIQDWRNHYFQCLCEPCKSNICEGDGVPLARVWVWDKEKDNCRVCRVAYIDPYPPYRRLLGPDCWPTHGDCIDLSRFIWREVHEVQAELCGLGFHDVEIGRAILINELVDLGDALGGFDVLCAPCNERVKIHQYIDICGRQRVALFERIPLL